MKRNTSLKVLLLLFLMMFFMMGCQKDNEMAASNTSVNQVLTVEGEDEEPTGDFKGFMWQVIGGPSEVYLFGSVHMADQDLYPFHPMVESAFESADHLVVEADINNMGSALELAALMSYETDTVYDHLSPEGVEKYEAICQELGINPQLYSKFKTWSVGSTLMSLQLMRSDYSATSGVDMYFLNQASRLQKDIIELEGMRFQLELMNSFTDEQQEMMFITPLGTIEETIADFDQLYKLFLTGDEETMTRFLMEEDNELNTDEAVERAMLQDRNLGMANKINDMMETGESYFLVVGLAHFLGDESVIDYLEQMGYTVERK